jgi:orotate phosphoribosyltransferase
LPDKHAARDHDRSGCIDSDGGNWFNRISKPPEIHLVAVRWLANPDSFSCWLTGSDSPLYDEKHLIDLVKRLALKTGQFRLASGKMANFYLDCRKLTLDGEGVNVVAEGILDLLESDMPDAVGGMAIGADPITAAVITLAHQRGHRLSGFIVRKQAKQHGTGRQVEGPVQPGQRAVVLEDVVTTGGSCLAAIGRVREFGLTVDRAIAIVDRQEGGSERFADAGVQLQSLLTIAQLGIDPATV